MARKLRRVREMSLDAETLTEARMFALAAPVLLPIIEKRRRSAYETMIGEHKLGKTDHVARVAELAALYDLEREIKSKQELYNNMMEKQK